MGLLIVFFVFVCLFLNVGVFSNKELLHQISTIRITTKLHTCSNTLQSI